MRKLALPSVYLLMLSVMKPNQSPFRDLPSKHKSLCSCACVFVFVAIEQHWTYDLTLLVKLNLFFLFWPQSFHWLCWSFLPLDYDPAEPRARRDPSLCLPNGQWDFQPVALLQRSSHHKFSGVPGTYSRNRCWATVASTQRGGKKTKDTCHSDCAGLARHLWRGVQETVSGISLS